MDIQLQSTRTKLSPRREPYWRSIDLGCHIGFRKTDNGSETWVGRYRLDGVNKTKALGHVASVSYSQAQKLAVQWFGECKGGVTDSCSVEVACKAYVENRKIEKPHTKAAKEADKRFKQVIYGTAFGKKKLEKLKALDVQQWRDNLPTDTRGHSSCNRYLNILKAALNYAHRMQLVASDHAWKVIKPFPNSNNRRELYLSIEERRDFVKACPLWLGQFITGLMYTGARPGELRRLQVKDLDLKTKSLKLVTFKGEGVERSREFPLASVQALNFFKEQCKDKLPNAYLFPLAEHHVSNGVKAVRTNPEIVAYTFRHCAIADWCSAGLPIADVAKLCGTSIEMIDKHYHKFIRSNIEEQLAGLQTI